MATLRDFKNDEPSWSEANAHIRGQLAYQGHLEDVVEEAVSVAVTKAVEDTQRKVYIETITNYMELRFNTTALHPDIKRLDLKTIKELSTVIYRMDNQVDIKKWINQHK